MRSWIGRKPLWIGVIVVAGGIAAVAMIPRASNTVSPPQVEGSRLISTGSGLVKQIITNEGQIVEKGEDMVMLDDTKEQEALLIAQGELAKLASEARESGIVVALPEAPPGLGGTIVQTGPLRVITGGSGIPKNVKPLPNVLPEGASSADPAPDPKTVASLKSKASKEIAEAKAEAERYGREIQDAKLELEEADRNRETSRIITDRAKLAADRAKMLLAQGAISVNENARLDGQLRLQQGILDAGTKRVDESKQKIATLTAERDKALKRSADAEEDLKNAPAAATPKLSVVTPTRKTTPEAQSAPRYARPAVIIPRRPETSTAPAKVEIDKSAKRETDDKLGVAKRKIDAAEAALLLRRIAAPRRMRIIKWLIKPSDSLTTSTPIAIVEFLPEMKKPAVPTPAEKSKESGVPLQKSTGFADNTR